MIIALLIVSGMANVALAIMCRVIYNRKKMYKGVCRKVYAKYAKMMAYEHRLIALAKKLSASGGLLKKSYSDLGEIVGNVCTICQQEADLADDAIEIDGNLEFGFGYEQQSKKGK